MAMTANSRIVFDYLKSVYPTEMTAQEIVSALGRPDDIKISTVTGSVNGLVKKGYAVRNESQVEQEDGKVKTVKHIILTDAGSSFDPDAEETAKK